MDFEVLNLRIIRRDKQTMTGFPKKESYLTRHFPLHTHKDAYTHTRFKPAFSPNISRYSWNP